MKDIVNIAVIGLGGRGSGMAEIMCKMKDINLIGVCDLHQDRIDEMVDFCVNEAHRPAPFATTDYKEIFKLEGLDTVYVATDWEMHVRISIDSMKAGIPVAMEVGGAYTLDECWELVDTYEETGVWAMMMENCCYDEREMMVHNMARDNVFGKIVYCSGKYAHDLREEVGYGDIERHYRLRNYLNRNCENYPTHELGPIAKILNINRGNRFTSLVSVCSGSFGMDYYVRHNKELKPSLGDKHFKQTDIVKTFIKTENGETIELTLDTCLPRFYSRDFTVRGLKGLYQGDGDIVYLDKESFRKKEWSQKNFWGRGSSYNKKYGGKLWKETTPEMLEAGHGGMDWFIIRAWIEAVKNDTLPPIDVYDAAAWMSITPLSEKSINEGSSTLEIPDFTRGKYKNREDKAEGRYAID